MEQILTKDGSLTYFNEEFSEHYHSVSGAKEEALKKFVLPSLNNYIFKDEIKILDVCFGLGYNSSCLIDEIKKRDKEIKIKIIALEKDKMILNKILDNNIDFESYKLIKECIVNNFYYEDDKLSIKIILGDALTEIKKLNEKFDFIFHDPFSTKKMPEFWSEDFFKEEFRLLKDNGRLTTYSCASVVRNNLKKVSFKTYDVEPVGRRAPSTLAVK
jgi:tRNA U34 5-methylaminomethyl-2-thiouridine-forming methyltransferase MnmC